MSYIGNPIVSTDFPVDYFSGNGSTTAFTLSIAPASVNSLSVQVSGVVQSPQTYTVSGTTLTFSAAPPTGSSNIVVRHLGIAGIPNTPSAGSVVTSSFASGAITSGLLPAGTVLQVVSATYSTLVTTTSTSPVTTNLAVSITPKFSTSKIFATVNLGGTGIGGNDVAVFYIYRGATQIAKFHDNFYHNSTIPFYAPVGMSALDSPATTSATTYTVYFSSGAGTEAVMNANSRTNSIITLMEIAA